MSRHRVKTHHWLSGTLRSREYFFETLEEALTFISGTEYHAAKVFDEEGRLVHERVGQVSTTYA